jgi:hypothetical protein
MWYFKNEHLTLIKSAPKKSFAQKTYFAGTFSIGETVFWLKLFLGAFFTMIKFKLLKSV